MTAASQPGLPLTGPQAAVWMAQKFDPTGYGYNVAEAINIGGELDPGLFAHAVAAVDAETQSLNVRFVEDVNGVRQVPLAPEPYGFEYRDLSGRPDAHAAAEELIRAAVRQPVDLSHNPSLGHLLLRLGPGAFRWFRGYHHLVADGVSGALLLRRVAETYTALRTGTAVPPDTAAPLARIVEEDLAYRASQAFTADREHWMSLLAEVPEPVDLTGRAHVLALNTEVRHGTGLPAATHRALRAAARRARTTWSVAVVAATAAYLHRAAGQEDLVIGLPVTGRATPAARRTPGMFANVLPLRLRVHRRMRTDEVLRMTSRAVREVLGHQRYRGEDLRRDVALRHGFDRLWGTEVNIMAFDHRSVFGEGVAATRVRSVNVGPVDHPSLDVFDRCDGSPVEVEFRSDAARCEPAELRAEHGRYVEFLGRFATDDTA